MTSNTEPDLKGFDKHKRETTPLLAVSPVSHLKPNHQSAGTISITS